MLRQLNSFATLASNSGEAVSAKVSTSRDLLMSQFWKNLQTKLQPAVPNERIAVPGKKWFSGFFSIGSIQKPLDQPLGHKYNLLFSAFTHETESLLPFFQFTCMRTNITLNPTIVQFVPVPSFDN